MEIKSPVFDANQKIPADYTCDGENINPPLEIENVPGGTLSLALIVDDPDAPNGNFVHWLMWNIEPTVTLIEEDSVPKGAVQGKTDFGKIGYGGPCPHSGTHHYCFTLYALDDKIIILEEGADRMDLEAEINGHIITEASLIGLYERQ